MSKERPKNLIVVVQLKEGTLTVWKDKMVLPNYCYQHSTIPHRHINWFVCHGCCDGTETEPKRSDLDFIEPHRDAFIDDRHPFGYRGKQRL